MSEIAVKQETALSIRENQTEFNPAQVATLTQLGVVNADRENLAVFFHQAVRTGLDPFARQIYMIGRQSSEWDPVRREKVTSTKYTIQTGIDGYRLIARRSAERSRVSLYMEDTLWCGSDGQWVDAWVFQYPPIAAKVVVWRGDERFSAVALWSEYVQTYRDKATGEQVPNSMWRKMPANQLAKCAEALALRKAFPQDLSGIYSEDELPMSESNGDASASDEDVTIQPRQPVRTQRPAPTPQEQPAEQPEPQDLRETHVDPEPPTFDDPVPDGQDVLAEPDFEGMGEMPPGAPAPTDAPASDGGGPCTREQQHAVVVQLKAMGCDSKEKANAIMSKFCGRQIGKSSEMTYDEANRFTGGVAS